jgi:aspartate-semialdehyde dehydrogenase
LQPVSSKGRQGVRELAGQTGELLNARGITPNVFPAQTAFNVLPLVGEMSGNQLMDELERVLPSPIPVVLSEAIVPVFYGMTVSLVVHTERDIDQDAIQSALISAGFLIEKDDENHELATPVGSASNTAGVVMSGLSALPAPLNGFRVWLLTDNIRQVVVNLTIKAVEKWIKRL